MLGATGFLSDFVKDEVKCRGLSVEDFGAEIDNEKNDIPLYDMYNRGLAACEEGMESYPAVSVRPRTLLMDLGSPNSKTGK